MAVIRLPADRLLLYSPVFLTDAVRDALEGLGGVSYVVAPNKIHNQTLAEYRKRYPAARLLAPPGLPERRPNLAFDGILEDAPDPEWIEDLDQVLTRGNVFFSEALFFHRRSRTLLVGDLVENFERGTASPLGLCMASLFGVRRRPVASPEFRFYTEDADAAAASLDRARRWDFERIFLCHGRMIEADARAVFDAVCEELLERVRRRGNLARWVFRRLAALQ